MHAVRQQKCRLWSYLKKWGSISMIHSEGREEVQDRWKHCLRVKRGMTDTSQPGGMYKDQVGRCVTRYICKVRSRYYGTANKLTSLRCIAEEWQLMTHYALSSRSECGFILRKVKKDPCKQNVLLKDMKKYMKAIEIIAKVNEVDTIFEPPEQWF